MSWYAVKNVADKSAEISIFDEIGLFGVTAKDFINELKSVGNRRVTLRIHSPGGEIFEGNAIYNALRRHPGGVDVAIDGLAASMASVIAMVGGKRSMAENAMLMIHNPWTVSFGEAKEMRKSADLLDDLKETIISAYAGRTGLDRKKLSEMMDEESWIGAQEAKELGFVTEITEPLSAYNSFHRFDISKFAKRPNNFMATSQLSKFLAGIAGILGVEPEAFDETKATEFFTAAVRADGESKLLAASVADLKASISAKDAEITGYTAKVSELTEAGAIKDKSISALTVERDSLKASLAEKTTQYDNLKRSYGLAPAQVVPVVPAGSGDGSKTPFQMFSAMPEGEEKTAFYNKHRAEILPFINRPSAK